MSRKPRSQRRAQEAPAARPPRTSLPPEPPPARPPRQIPDGPFNLRRAIAQQRASSRTHEDDVARQREAVEAAHREEARSRVERFLSADFGPQMAQALDITIQNAYNQMAGDPLGATASFVTNTRWTWSLAPSDHPDQEARRWRINGPLGIVQIVRAEEVREVLIALLGSWQEYEVKIVERDAARQVALQLEEQALDRIAAATADAWQWPEGRELHLYRWRWAISDADSIQTGWSLSDTFDGRGYLTLYPKRRIKLDGRSAEVEELIVTSLDELPQELREPQLISVGGISRGYISALGRDGWALRDDSQLTAITFGERPIAWVRQALDT